MADALLRVTRTSPRDIKIRDLYLELDGKEVGNVLYGDAFEMPVAPGAHKITATNRLYHRSDTFSCKEGEKIEYDVANTATGCGGLLFVVVGMGPYKVQLKRRHSSEAKR